MPRTVPSASNAANRSPSAARLSPSLKTIPATIHEVNSKSPGLYSQSGCANNTLKVDIKIDINIFLRGL